MSSDLEFKISTKFHIAPCFTLPSRFFVNGKKNMAQINSSKHLLELPAKIYSTLVSLELSLSPSRHIIHRALLKMSVNADKVI